MSFIVIEKCYVQSFGIKQNWVSINVVFFNLFSPFSFYKKTGGLHPPTASRGPTFRSACRRRRYVSCITVMVLHYGVRFEKKILWYNLRKDLNAHRQVITNYVNSLLPFRKRGGKLSLYLCLWSPISGQFSGLQNFFRII